MELTNLDLIVFTRGFPTLSELTGFDFVMALNRQFEKIEKEVKLLDKIQDPTEKVKEYRKAAGKLYSEYAEKDSSGSPELELSSDGKTQKYVMDKGREVEFGEKFKALKKGSQKDLDLHVIKEEEYVKALEAKAKVKLTPFKKDIIPKGITTGQLRLLFSVGLVK